MLSRRELRGGLPADKTGLKIGDRVVGCNEIGLATAKSERAAKRLCQVEAGKALQLDVQRAGMPLELSVVAEFRPELIS